MRSTVARAAEEHCGEGGGEAEVELRQAQSRSRSRGQQSKLATTRLQKELRAAKAVHDEVARRDGYARAARAARCRRDVHVCDGGIGIQTEGTRCNTHGPSKLRSTASQRRRLDYGGLKWKDEEIEVLCRALHEAKALLTLILAVNQIGDAGVAALVTCLREGAAPELKEIRLYKNQIGDAGAVALAAVPARGRWRRSGDGRPQRQPDWRRRRGGARGVPAPRVRATRSKLENIYLGKNQIGDAGAAALVACLREVGEPMLEPHGKHIGDAGVAAL